MQYLNLEILSLRIPPSPLPASSSNAQQVFADRLLNSTDLLCGADDLVDRGILRKGFARFLWNMDGGRGTGAGLLGPLAMKPAKFEEILEEIGVTIPLPGLLPEASAEEGGRRNAPALVAGKIETPGDDDGGGGGGGDGEGDGTDMLVIMRLPSEPDADARATLASVRELALGASRSDGGGGGCVVGGRYADNAAAGRLKAVFEFDHAGAPHGLPERVMALSHKIGSLSQRARWRHGGLFILHDDGENNSSSSGSGGGGGGGGSKGASSFMVLEYDKRLKLFSVQALGWTAPCLRAVRFVISALFHVASDFPGASWTGWVECGMGHDGEKMYHLAPSDEKQVGAVRISPKLQHRVFSQEGPCILDVF